MIDLHTHILPGVDDGARDLAEAVQMCRMAAEDGCEVLCCTPHQRHDSWTNDQPTELLGILRSVQEAVGESPKLLLGGEVRVDSELLHEIDRRPGSGILPLADSRYILIEFDRSPSGPDPIAIVDDLNANGWHPIVAHPELLPHFTTDTGLIEDLIAAGALIQVTAMSLTGDFGATPQRFVSGLLEAELVHFIASDSHGVRWRPPGLSHAHRIVERNWGRQMADQLTSDNPRAVIENRAISAS